MKWTVGKKMFLIGTFVVLGVGVLAGNNFFTNTSIHKTSELMHLRNNQIDTVNRTLQSHLNLMLAAMDSIVDKNEGKIDKELMESINTDVALINANLKNLDELADTEEEKRLSQELHSLFDNLAAGIQVNLVKLIENSGSRMAEIEAEFAKVDDVLDESGESISNGLEAIEASFKSKFEEAQRTGDGALLAASAKLNVVEVQQWLTDISATRGAEGYDDGFGEAEKHATLLYEDLEKLLKVAPHTREKIEALRSSFKAFYEKGKWMATQYIEHGPSKGNEAMAQFDAYAEDIGNRVEQLMTQIDVSATKAKKIKEGLDLVEKIRIAQLDLILAAMDSIVDKNEGRVDEERMGVINTNVEYLTANLDAFDKTAETKEEKELVEDVRSAIPKLTKGVQVDLVRLIEKSGAEAAQIEAEFAKIDDVLDQNGEKLEDNLRKIQASVQEEVKEAEEASTSMLNQSKMVGWIVSLVALAATIAALWLIARSIINPITRVTRNMSEGSDQVASASGQVSSSSQSLAEWASEQAASIEETSSSLEEMSSMTKQNADNAHQADNLMKEANQVVGQANESMRDLTTSMSEISKASEETSKIIKTIDEIAFQTNLLALNAAVEAARAGEAGAGFAVVADEVRNLAMRAADAAKNTADLIEGTVKKVKDGSELVTKTDEAFTQVAESAGKVGELVGEIAAASNEQSQGIDQTNKAVAEMDKVVQQNAANAEESASASEEMNAQAEQMKGMVGELVALVGGSAKGKAHRAVTVTPTVEATTRHVVPAHEKKAKITAVALHKTKEVNPEQVISLRDDDFKDF